VADNIEPIEMVEQAYTEVAVVDKIEQAYTEVAVADKTVLLHTEVAVVDIPEHYTEVVLEQISD
jgi:3-dehydroquinate dehydratase